MNTLLVISNTDDQYPKNINEKKPSSLNMTVRVAKENLELLGTLKIGDKILVDLKKQTLKKDQRWFSIIRRCFEPDFETSVIQASFLVAYKKRKKVLDLPDDCPESRKIHIKQAQKFEPFLKAAFEGLVNLKVTYGNEKIMRQIESIRREFVSKFSKPIAEVIKKKMRTESLTNVSQRERDVEKLITDLKEMLKQRNRRDSISCFKGTFENFQSQQQVRAQQKKITRRNSLFNMKMIEDYKQESNVVDDDEAWRLEKPKQKRAVLERRVSLPQSRFPIYTSSNLPVDESREKVRLGFFDAELVKKIKERRNSMKVKIKNR